MTTLDEVRTLAAAMAAAPCPPSALSMGWSTPAGGCAFCDRKIAKTLEGFDRWSRPMIVCAECGNKRCPHATWHGNDCTGSNEPGQPATWPQLKPEHAVQLLTALDGVLAVCDNADDTLRTLADGEHVPVYVVRAAITTALAGVAE